MKPPILRVLSLASLCLLLQAAGLRAESKKPSDYPLRIHVFSRSETTFYHARSAEEAKGEGRANLFENGQAHAIDFSFDCDQKLKDSFGYETYPARWKKPGQVLIVLLPVFGKANNFFTCDFKTDVKDFAYTSHAGRMSSEPVDRFKAWMVKNDYDPEHGKNAPTRPEPETTAAPPPQAPPGTRP